MRITHHASMRMKERNISIQSVNTVFAYGKRMVNKHDSSKTTIVDNKLNLYIVIDKKDNVVTVFKKER